MITGEYDLAFEHGSIDRTASVIVPLYNYENYIRETLETVAAQSEDDLCLIVINDCSKDSSLQAAAEWFRGGSLGRKSGFLLSHKTNAGLSVSRNTGIAFSRSEFCFFLDADNLLYPRCVQKHVSALRANPRAQAAYSIIEVFDADAGLQGCNVFDRDRLKKGNYIDAMAMVRREYLNAVGGYHAIKHGWEDYDLWLRMCEDDSMAIHVPEILSRYRVHQSSMLRTQTNVLKNLRELYDTMYERHPWLQLSPLPK